MNLKGGELAKVKNGDTYGIRPEHLVISDAEDAWTMRIKLIETLGAESIIYLASDDHGDFVMRTEGEVSLEAGSVVGFHLVMAWSISFAAVRESDPSGPLNSLRWCCRHIMSRTPGGPPDHDSTTLDCRHLPAHLLTHPRLINGGLQVGRYHRFHTGPARTLGDLEMT